MKKLILFFLLVVGSIVYAANLSTSITEMPSTSTEVMHGCHRVSCMPPCPRCAFPKNSRGIGHCRKNGKVRRCTRPLRT